jgi:hypothetical protein
MISHEFDNLLPEIIYKVSRKKTNTDEHDILVSITEARNRVRCIIQTM